MGEDWASLPLPAGLVTLLGVFFGGMVCLVSRKKGKERWIGLDGRQRKVRAVGVVKKLGDEKE